MPVTSFSVVILVQSIFPLLAIDVAHEVVFFFDHGPCIGLQLTQKIRRLCFG